MDRRSIIETYSKAEFMDFLNNDNSGKVLELFDDEGIAILRDSKLKGERIRYTLVHSSYKNELMRNNAFVDTLLNSNVNEYYACLRGLSFNLYINLIERALFIQLPYEKIASLFSYFDLNYQLTMIDNLTMFPELLGEIVKKSSDILVINKIINDYNIDLVSHNINLGSYFSLAKESVLKAQEMRIKCNHAIPQMEIPARMITIEMAKKIWQENDVFSVRKILNDASYCTDISVLNDYVKRREDSIINNCDEFANVSPFDEMYQYYIDYIKIKSMLDKDGSNVEIYNAYYNQRRKLFELIDKECGKDFPSIDSENSLLIINKIKELSGRSLSNYIIDYHFEENYYNIMLDIRELLNFYVEGNVMIPDDRIELYKKIENIDHLSLEEKKELHNLLKNINIMEMFYDDMALARSQVSKAIKDYSLNLETIKQYRSEELSRQYGVDVYILDGEPFFGIVKTSRRQEDDLPTGRSYSLIGSDGLAVFGDISESETYLYDASSLNSDQVVHVYPYDSFTLYRPFECVISPSSKVNTLAAPEELVNATSSYNEILILERGARETSMDSKLPTLRRMALYCLDEIRSGDVDAAINNNVGIFLVRSSRYKPQEHVSLYQYRMGIDYWKYEYFNDVNRKKEFESKRK